MLAQLSDQARQWLAPPHVCVLHPADLHVPPSQQQASSAAHSRCAMLLVCTKEGQRPRRPACSTSGRGCEAGRTSWTAGCDRHADGALPPGGVAGRSGNGVGLCTAELCFEGAEAEAVAADIGGGTFVGGGVCAAAAALPPRGPGDGTANEDILKGARAPSCGGAPLPPFAEGEGGRAAGTSYSADSAVLRRDLRCMPITSMKVRTGMMESSISISKLSLYCICTTTAQNGTE